MPQLQYNNSIVFLNGTSFNTLSATAVTVTGPLSSASIIYDQAGNSGLWTTIVSNLTATANTTINNPTGTFQDGQRMLYRITQGGIGANLITLDTKFRIPRSSSDPLPFSTTLGYTDMLGVMYNKPVDKWDVISFIPGY